jgi:hypothetical protein
MYKAVFINKILDSMPMESFYPIPSGSNKNTKIGIHSITIKKTPNDNHKL